MSQQPTISAVAATGSAASHGAAGILPLGHDDLFLVTGATGFLGAAVARRLREAGARVRVLARANSNRRNIDPADELAIGDLV